MIDRIRDLFRPREAPLPAPRPDCRLALGSRVRTVGVGQLHPVGRERTHGRSALQLQELELYERGFTLFFRYIPLLRHAYAHQRTGVHYTPRVVDDLGTRYRAVGVEGLKEAPEATRQNVFLNWRLCFAPAPEPAARELQVSIDSLLYVDHLSLLLDNQNRDRREPGPWRFVAPLL